MKRKLTRTLALAIALAAPVLALQGCFTAVATGAAVATLSLLDRRSTGMQIEDEKIELTASSRIRDRLGELGNVSVTSFNRNVLLTGQVPDQAARDEVARIAFGVNNVRGVNNEAEVAGVSSLSQDSSDVLLTSKVKARFLDSQRIAANHVKVVSEIGVVYLMGLVTEREAAEAKKIAATTAGVRRVVAIFEIISEAQAKELDVRASRDKKAESASAR